VQRGIVTYGEGGLGGIVARLHRPAGGYFYYAHLSATNAETFPDGSTVERGDVLGACGNSGNAITTPPHVHFGWYRSSGVASNPMRRLIAWLERAEEAAAVTVARASGRRVASLGALTSARRFGDGLIPGLDPSAQSPLNAAAVAEAVLTGAMVTDAANSGPHIAEESAD
jgi:Peptidase family M23